MYELLLAFLMAFSTPTHSTAKSSNGTVMTQSVANGSDDGSGDDIDDTGQNGHIPPPPPPPPTNG